MPALFGYVLFCTNLCALYNSCILHRLVYLCASAADSAAHTEYRMGNKPWSNFCIAPAAFEPLVHTSPARPVTVRGTVAYWVFGVSKDIVGGVGNRN